MTSVRNFFADLFPAWRGRGVAARDAAASKAAETRNPRLA